MSDIIEEEEIPFEPMEDEDENDVIDESFTNVDLDEGDNEEENKKMIDRGKGYKRPIKIKSQQ